MAGALGAGFDPSNLSNLSNVATSDSSGRPYDEAHAGLSSLSRTWPGLGTTTISKSTYRKRRSVNGGRPYCYGNDSGLACAPPHIPHGRLVHSLDLHVTLKTRPLLRMTLMRAVVNRPNGAVLAVRLLARHLPEARSCASLAATASRI